MYNIYPSDGITAMSKKRQPNFLDEHDANYNKTLVALPWSTYHIKAFVERVHVHDIYLFFKLFYWSKQVVQTTG